MLMHPLRMDYGSRGLPPETDTVPLYPDDIVRMVRSGFGESDIIEEINRRGFTGFPDLWESRLPGFLNVPEGIQNATKLASNRLSKQALADLVGADGRGFIDPLRSGMVNEGALRHQSANSTDAIQSKAATEMLVLIDGLKKLEFIRSQMAAASQDVTPCDLKTRLIKLRLIEGRALPWLLFHVWHR